MSGVDLPANNYFFFFFLIQYLSFKKTIQTCSDRRASCHRRLTFRPPVASSVFSFKVSQAQLYCATPTCLRGCSSSSSQVTSPQRYEHAKRLWNSKRELGGTQARTEWTKLQSSGTRDGLWNELQLENHQGDIPHLAANFTIIIILSFMIL